jgi:hypothetical protein
LRSYKPPPEKLKAVSDPISYSPDKGFDGKSNLPDEIFTGPE